MYRDPSEQAQRLYFAIKSFTLEIFSKRDLGNGRISRKLLLRSSMRVPVGTAYTIAYHIFTLHIFTYSTRLRARTGSGPNDTQQRPCFDQRRQ